MLLKINKSKIDYNRRLLDIDRSATTATTSSDGSHIVVTFKTNSPHKLNIGDIVLFSRDIASAETYEHVFTYLNSLSSNLVELKYAYLTKDVIIKKYNNKNELVDVSYDKGYYRIGKNKYDETDIVKVVGEEFVSLISKYNSYNDNLKVTPQNFTKYTFSISFEMTKKIYIDEIVYGETIDVAHFKGDLPYRFNEYENFTLYKKNYHYVRKKSATDEEKNNLYETTENPINSEKYLGYDEVIFNSGVYVWTGNTTTIECKSVNEKHFTFTSRNVFENDILEIEDNRFITSIGRLKSDVLLYEYYGSLNFNLLISSNNVNELTDSEICANYFKERKNSLITPINDYEKRCFTPYHYSKLSKKYTPVHGINFNLFFRDRSGSDDWSTNDALGWNQYKIKYNGSFEERPNKNSLTNGDLLSFLNFTDDDVYYRKKKISKSFLRLSFYATNNPLNNMLLFYSTIFFDSGELFGKYIKNVNLKNNGTTDSLVSYANGGENNLTASFKVNDRYDKNKSSEGFYLYMFPDYLEATDINGDISYPTRTIYMRAEFNHAGYGKTIPLIFPNNGDGKILSFSDTNFPTSLVNSDGELTELYRQLFIPLKVMYNKEIGDYIYYFDTTNNVNNNELTFNLYEPKVNSLV